MKTIRQLVTFLLGVSVGVCLYSLLRFRPLPSLRQVLSHGQALDQRAKQIVVRPEVKVLLTAAPADSLGGPAAPPKDVEIAEASLIPLPSWPQPQITEPLGFASSMAREKRRAGAPVSSLKTAAAEPQTKIERVSIEPHIASKEALKANAVHHALTKAKHVSRKPQLAAISATVESHPRPLASPPEPATFKALGYVEKSDGQREAVIMQENEIQVVHVGDRISDRYRVTTITPELVGAVDETILQIPILKSGGVPDVAVSSAQAIPLSDYSDKTPPPTMATVIPEDGPVGGSALPRKKVSAGPEIAGFSPLAKQQQDDAVSLGYVEKSDGKVEAIVADGDSVRLVPSTQREVMANAAHLPTLPRGSQAAEISTVRSNETSATIADLDLAVNQASADYSANVSVETLFRQPMHSEPEIASGSPSSQTDIPIEMNPLGFVVKANGEFASILGRQGEVYLAWEGDHFGGHLRSAAGSLDPFDKSEDNPKIVPQAKLVAYVSPAAPESTPASLPVPVNRELVVDTEVTENIDDRAHDKTDSAPFERGGTSGNRHGLETYSKSSATFIFQTLGYVESQSGEVKAIVADGADTYIVKQGDVFAQHYQAVSVDQLMVLAVRKPALKPLPDFLMTQTDFGDNPASKKLSRTSALNLLGGAGVPVVGGTGREEGAGSNLSPSINLLNMLTSELLGGHSYSYTTDTN